MNTLLVELFQRLERLELPIRSAGRGSQPGSAEADPGNAENGDGERA